MDMTLVKNVISIKMNTKLGEAFASPNYCELVMTLWYAEAHLFIIVPKLWTNMYFMKSPNHIALKSC